MAKKNWAAFPYKDKAFDYAGDKLAKAWPKLHAGDQEPFPDQTHIAALLEEIQQNLFDRAKAHRDGHITKVDSWAEFVEVLENKGGFLSAHWDGTTETEVEIKEKTKATIRCIPLDAPDEPGACVLTGKPSKRRVLFAKAY